MNTTLSRIALAAPAAALALGFGISSAEAAPYQPSESNKIQQQDWDDVVIDDFTTPEDEPEDPPADPPAEPPADEPADEPADDDSEDESEDDSDEQSEDEDSDQGSAKPDRPKPAKPSKDSTDEEANDDAAPVDTIQTTATELTPPVRQAGVQVPLLALIAGGTAITGVAGWAAYRRHVALAG